MVTDLQVKLSNDLLDIADKRIEDAKRLMEEANKILAEAEEIREKAADMLVDEKERRQFKDCFREMKKEAKMTWEKIGENMNNEGYTVSSRFSRTRAFTLRFATRLANAAGAELALISKNGEIYPLAIEEWLTSGKGFSPSRFSALIRKGIQDREEGDAEIWFE